MLQRYWILQNPNISPQTNIDLLETLDDNEAKTESFYNLSNNDNVINKNDIALSVNYAHSMINDNASQNYIDEDSLKSTKDKEISHNDIKSVSSKLIMH